MKIKNEKKLYLSVTVFVLFVVWTILVKTVDVCSIGPLDTTVGFSTLNGLVHKLTGVNMYLYEVTDFLGLVPIAVVVAFGFLGFLQWCRRKSILKVDRSILALGVFYAVVVAAYVFFEIVVVNYRPILIDGCLEASYPSSTTLLVMCVIPTAVMQLDERLKNRKLKRIVDILAYSFLLFMLVGRLISGVHWISDIVGGMFLSVALVLLYLYAVEKYGKS